MPATLRNSLLLCLLALAWSCAPSEEPTAAEQRDPPERAEPRPVVQREPGERIRAAIQHVRQRDLLTSNSFWTVFHGILGVGPDTTLLHAESGQRVKAIDYICQGGEIRGLQFLPTRHGLDVRMGPSYIGQGHQDQFVAEMAQWGMPIDRRFVV